MRNAFVSVDPYMRGRMNDARSYVPPFALGEPLRGGAVGQIVASRNDRWPEGTWVQHDLGWREAAVLEGRGIRPVDPALAPVSTSLGVLGMTGLTAFVGVVDIGEVREGETVFVSGAAGAVGSIAAQLARARGARVVGSAGTPEKVAWLRELGLDARLRLPGDADETGAARARARRDRPLLRQCGWRDARGCHRRDAAPRSHRRVRRDLPLQRDGGSPGPRNLFMVVTKRLRMQGFIVSDHNERFPAFMAEVAPLVADGTIRYRETVVDGIEHAPEAFIGMLEGANVGKMLVRVGPGPEDA